MQNYKPCTIDSHRQSGFLYINSYTKSWCCRTIYTEVAANQGARHQLQSPEASSSTQFGTSFEEVCHSLGSFDNWLSYLWIAISMFNPSSRTWKVLGNSYQLYLSHYRNPKYDLHRHVLRVEIIRGTVVVMYSIEVSRCLHKFLIQHPPCYPRFCRREDLGDLRLQWLGGLYGNNSLCNLLLWFESWIGSIQVLQLLFSSLLDLRYEDWNPHFKVMPSWVWIPFTVSC